MSFEQVRASDVDELSQGISGYAQDMDSGLDQAKKAVGTLADSSDFTGQGAEAIKAYFTEVHGQLIDALGTLADELESLYAQYDSTYHSKVDNGDFVFAAQGIGGVPGDLSPYGNSVRQAHDSVTQILGGIYGIVKIDNPKIDGFESSMSDATGRSQDIIKKVNQVEDKARVDSLEKLENAIVTVLNQCSATCGGSGYVPGSFAASSAGSALASETASAKAYNEQLAATVAQNRKDVTQRIDQRVARLQSDGDWKMLAGGLSAIVDEGGSILSGAELGGKFGVPGAIVGGIAGFIIGIPSAAFDVSDVCEGYNMTVMAKEGDVTGVASNPLCDWLFKGDKSSYNTWNNRVHFATGLVNVAAGGVSFAKGASGLTTGGKIFAGVNTGIGVATSLPVTNTLIQNGLKLLPLDLDDSARGSIATTLENLVSIGGTVGGKLYDHSHSASGSKGKTMPEPKPSVPGVELPPSDAPVHSPGDLVGADGNRLHPVPVPPPGVELPPPDAPVHSPGDLVGADGKPLYPVPAPPPQSLVVPPPDWSLSDGLPSDAPVHSPRDLFGPDGNPLYPVPAPPTPGSGSMLSDVGNRSTRPAPSCSYNGMMPLDIAENPTDFGLSPEQRMKHYEKPLMALAGDER